VRLARAYLHPRVLTETGGNLPGQMRVTFTVALVAMALLFVTLWKLELATKNAADQLRHLRRVLASDAERPAGAPAPPVSTVPARPVP
jgi:heme exporter protein C